MRGFQIALLAVACLISPASLLAGLIDDIEAASKQGVTEFRIHFNMPVRYIKHFPAERGELLKVYLQAFARDGLETVSLETYRRVPAVSGAPAFVLQYTTLRNCYAVLDPVCLDIQFNRPVQYQLRPGDDGRSLILVVLPESASTPPVTKPKGR